MDIRTFTGQPNPSTGGKLDPSTETGRFYNQGNISSRRARRLWRKARLPGGFWRDLQEHPGTAGL